MKLEISLYKFDAKSDYLPYYTKHYIETTTENTLLDILQTINKESEFGFENSLESAVVVNGLYTTLGLTLKQIKKDFGKCLQIDPLSNRSAYKDLLINDDVFYEKLTLLNDLSNEDRATYESYKIYYYASNSLNFNKDYIGDAFILLASKLLEKKSNVKAINEALLDEKNGIVFHTNLANRVYDFDQTVESKIKEVQKKLTLTKPLEEQNFKPNSTKTISFEDKYENSLVKHSFEEFNIAYYKGESSCENTELLIDTLKAKKLTLSSMNNDLAMDTFHKNPNFSYKLAAEVMLDAFDNSADFIVVDSLQAFYLLDFNRKELQKASGRDITLPVIHTSELSLLANGSHDSARKTLSQHDINPDII